MSDCRDAVAFFLPVCPPVILGQQDNIMCDVFPPRERHERQQETDGQRGVSSVLLKACKGCGRLIPQALTMCEQCEARQQSRHVTYNNTRRDPRAAEFYLSK